MFVVTIFFFFLDFLFVRCLNQNVLKTNVYRRFTENITPTLPVHEFPVRKFRTVRCDLYQTYYLSGSTLLSSRPSVKYLKSNEPYRFDTIVYFNKKKKKHYKHKFLLVLYIILFLFGSYKYNTVRTSVSIERFSVRITHLVISSNPRLFSLTGGSSTVFHPENTRVAALKQFNDCSRIPQLLFFFFF